LRLSNPELRVGVEASNGSAKVSVGSAPKGAAVVQGSARTLSTALLASTAVRFGEILLVGWQ